ncbi:hypothetical protein FNV43_RR01762 [Rhamnella rubrinervis]|uniref:Cupin type-1 domain-containing protein n=1 Tax=Rhamnella rubrinervis TaxID=2594499 RepID=A0A8K0HR22_9ROSA|nr:hypothetical protein FNV43_RR01762 [Rhamnella rubrinervis]
MIKTTKLPLWLLFLSSLLLASISSTLGYGLIKVNSKSDLEECFNQCKQQYGDDPQSFKQLACQEVCVLQELGKQEGERRGSGQGGVSGREGRDTESPAARGEFEQCQQRCHQQEHDQKQCQQRCEQHRRQREGEEEGRGRGSDTRGDQQCRRQCEQREGTAQERQLCKRMCRHQYEKESGQEGNDVDPRKRYEQCRQRCQRRAQDPQQQQQCESHCRKQLQEDQGQQTGEEQSWDESNMEDLQEKFRKYQRKCQKHKQGQSQSQKEQMKERDCMQKCQQKYREKQQGQKGRDRVQNPESHSQEDNPYYFPAQESESWFRTQEGHLRVTERFTDKSELLRGIDDYRFAILVARPNTFVIPHHCDAESILAVVRGKGTISLVRQNKRESYNIENGDVIRVPAGTTVYLINQQNNEDLEIAKLLQSVNNPGEFKVPRDQLENIFGKETRGMRQGQRQAIAIKASQEQLRALSKHVSSTKQITDRDSNGPIKLPSQKPLYSNDFGKLFETNPEEYKQLKDMDVLVDLVEINQGAIMVSHHNSRATIVSLVLEGSGQYEMACPHLSSQEEGEQMEDSHHISSGNRFQKVSANLSPGDVFVVPAGHPISIVASQNQNLRMLGFGINGLNNQRNFLAGKESMMNQVEREAKEVAFNVEGEDMEQIFNKQKLSYFVPQQQSQQQGQRGRDQPLSSILDFADFL